MKTCSKCKSILDESQFSKNKRTKDGLQSRCKQCSMEWYRANRDAQRERMMRYHWDHRERKLSNRRSWGSRNKDRNTEYARRWREQNPDKVQEQNMRRRGTRAEYNKRRYYSNPEFHRARVRAYYQEHAEERRAVARDTAREKRRSNPAVNKERCKRRYYAIKAATIGRVDYGEIIRRDHSLCHICGGYVSRDEMSYDHVIPLSKGGLHCMDNIKVSHLVCNIKKSNKLPGEYEIIGADEERIA